MSPSPEPEESTGEQTRPQPAQATTPRRPAARTARTEGPGGSEQQRAMAWRQQQGGGNVYGGQQVARPRSAPPRKSKSGSPSLWVDLNLDVEVQLKAKIHGDLTLAILDNGSDDGSSSSSKPVNAISNIETRSISGPVR